MPCIYQIKNVVNNKIYVGSTQKEKFSRRKSEHLSELKHNKHKNQHLQNAWNKYGEETFIFEILEEFKFPLTYTKEYIYDYIIAREVFYIQTLNPQYNIAKVINGGKLGRKLSEEQILYLSYINKGKRCSDYTRQLIKDARAKQIITEEHKLKISKGLKGRKGTRQKPFSDKTKLKLSIHARDQIAKNVGMHSPQSKEKRTNTLKNKFNTVEMKQVLRDSARKRTMKKFCVKKDGIIVGTFLNQCVAAEELGFKTPWGICAVLNNIQKTHKGYTFEYLS
jgi:group I intron endonuclease